MEMGMEVSTHLEIQLGLRNYYILQKELDVDTFLQKRIRWNLKSDMKGWTELANKLLITEKKRGGGFNCTHGSGPLDLCGQKERM